MLRVTLGLKFDPFFIIERVFIEEVFLSTSVMWQVVIGKSCQHAKHERRASLDPFYYVLNQYEVVTPK